jgi:hypothetical protein
MDCGEDMAQLKEAGTSLKGAVDSLHVRCCSITKDTIGSIEILVTDEPILVFGGDLPVY